MAVGGGGGGSGGFGGGGDGDGASASTLLAPHPCISIPSGYYQNMGFCWRSRHGDSGQGAPKHPYKQHTFWRPLSTCPPACLPICLLACR